MKMELDYWDCAYPENIESDDLEAPGAKEERNIFSVPCMP